MTMILVAASTTPFVLAHSFTPGILQRLPDAESGLPLVGLSGAGDHIVHALLFTTSKLARANAIVKKNTTHVIFLLSVL